jgi:hypothetical protein
MAAGRRCEFSLKLEGHDGMIADLAISGASIVTDTTEFIGSIAI